MIWQLEKRSTFSADHCNTFVWQQNYVTSWWWMNSWNSSRSATQQTNLFVNNANTEVKKESVRRLTKRRMSLTKNVLLLAEKTFWALILTISPGVPNQKISVIHSKVIDMIFCGNPVPITIRTSQTIASLQVLSPATLKIKPLKIVKVSTTDVIVIATTQESTLMIVMIAGIMTTSQLLVIVEK